MGLTLLAELLGAHLLIRATFNLAGARLAIQAQQEARGGPLFGTLNGILTGTTSRRHPQGESDVW